MTIVNVTVLYYLHDKQVYKHVDVHEGPSSCLVAAVSIDTIIIYVLVYFGTNDFMFRKQQAVVGVFRS